MHNRIHKRERTEKKKFKETVGKNLPNFMKIRNLQIQEN